MLLPSGQASNITNELKRLKQVATISGTSPRVLGSASHSHVNGNTRPPRLAVSCTGIFSSSGCRDPGIPFAAAVKRPRRGGSAQAHVSAMTQCLYGHPRACGITLPVASSCALPRHAEQFGWMTPRPTGLSS